MSILELAMTTKVVRSTFYLEADLHWALCNKAAIAHRSMSEIVNDAVRKLLQEDEEDLAVFSSRAKENSVSYQQFLANLNAQ